MAINDGSSGSSIDEKANYDGKQAAYIVGGRPTLQEYMEQAAISRAEEDGRQVEKHEAQIHKTQHELELDTARRALRTASYWAVFYLITTDILGPFNAPYAFSQVGYVPGVILYVVMGFMACYTGLLLWRLFVNLDSHTYPVKTFADLGERSVGGVWFGHLCSVLQTVQLIINVGTICLSNAQSVEQIANQNQFCFSVAILIWALFGMIIGQIRTLKSYGWLANSAVWFNLLIIFTSMGFVAHSPPNYAAALTSLGQVQGPIMKSAFVSLPLFSKVNGIMNMVFAYGGAMIFPEFMAEMRRPMDFWKGMCMAQTLIMVCYMMYGLFVYSFQGQFTLGLAYQGVSIYAWQTVNNVFALITGIIAAGLYGNIGIKIAYYNVVETWCKGPSMMTKRGHFYWAITVVVYWALAFIVGSAIPQVQTISGLVAAICIMQFTYTFPPLLYACWKIRMDAAVNDIGDTWYHWSRWQRGLFSGQWYYKIFNIIIALASAAMACLGMYGSGTAIKVTFETPGTTATSFGCVAPV